MYYIGTLISILNTRRVLIRKRPKRQKHLEMSSKRNTRSNTH